MTDRHQPLRLTAVAALTALAGFGAQAIEATQWEPRAEASATASAGTEATREPVAWTVSRSEATEFRDGMARDTMASRQAVRQELAEAREHGLIADTGEGGATERVWRQRAEFAAAEHERHLAQAGADPIAHIAAVRADDAAAVQASADPSAMAETTGSMYAVAPDGTLMSLPPAAESDVNALVEPAWEPADSTVTAGAPTRVEDGSGPLAGSTTVEVR